MIPTIRITGRSSMPSSGGSPRRSRAGSGMPGVLKLSKAPRRRARADLRTLRWPCGLAEERSREEHTGCHVDVTTTALRKCRHKQGTRSKCHCPVWPAALSMADGCASLKTRDLRRAAKRWRRGSEGSARPRGWRRRSPPLAHHERRAAETKRNTGVRWLPGGFWHRQRGVRTRSRSRCWTDTSGARERELTAEGTELLRQFFNFCIDREWTSKNPAKRLRRPQLRKQPRSCRIRGGNRPHDCGLRPDRQDEL
jgi:hypothetical protein